jgi:type II secretory ATPase GspE/PulE/Tfp pilus assembly ATPase PilB-like protein
MQLFVEKQFVELFRLQSTSVRFRIDGTFLDYLKVPPLYRRALASRLKIMARIDIAERRKPQDGKIRFRLSDREIEVRVATLPTVGTGNEDLVLRILDPTRQVALDHLHTVSPYSVCDM